MTTHFRIISIFLFVCFFSLTTTVFAQIPCVPGTGACPGESPILDGGYGSITLQSMLGALYGAFNSYIIPFLVTIAFIAFIINVVRYFILKSDSEDGRSNARRYLIWSLIGFVIIVAMWGIINLFILLFGFNSFGGIVCPDYDPTCNPSGIVIGTSPTSNGRFISNNLNNPSSAPNTEYASFGGFRDSPINSGTSGGSLPPLGVQDTAPETPGITNGVYSNVGAAAQLRLVEKLGLANTFLTNELSIISANRVLDDSRIRTAVSFTNAGIIRQSELSQIAIDINQVRQSVGLTSIPLNSVLTDSQYVENIKTIYENIPMLRIHLVNYYVKNGLPQATAQANADVDMQGIFNINNTFATRVNTASDIMLNVMEGNPEHPAFTPLLLALNAEGSYAGCGVVINSSNLFQAPCG